MHRHIATKQTFFLLPHLNTSCFDGEHFAIDRQIRFFLCKTEEASVHFSTPCLYIFLSGIFIVATRHVHTQIEHCSSKTTRKTLDTHTQTHTYTIFYCANEFAIFYYRTGHLRNETGYINRSTMKVNGKKKLKPLSLSRRH